MKKNILAIIFILLLTTACSSSHLKNLKLDELNKKLDNQESFILFLTDEKDESKTLKNTLEKVSRENNITSFYLNTETLEDKDLESLKDIFTYQTTNFILFVKDGHEKTVLSRVEDLYIRDEKLEEVIKNQGFIK